MIKILFALLPLLVVCSGQATELTNLVEFDANFRLRWEVLNTPGDIILQMEAATPGWVSFMISSPDGSYGDLLWGGFANETGQEVGYLLDMHCNLTLTATPPHTTPEPDSSIDTILQGVYYHEPWTIIRVKRSLNTGDADDVIIGQGSYKIGWAYSDTNNFPLTPHVKNGLADHIFIP